MTKAW